MKNFLRFLTISRVLVKYRLDNIVLSAPLFKSFRPLLYLTPWHYFPVKKLTRGERIRRALEELGPIFIKFGQTLSTRLDLLPDDIGIELAKLQDSCPAFDSKQARQIIEKSLGNKIDELFSNFEEVPLASASIAQVHTAITKNNEDVIIKVVRPNILKQIKRDVSLLYTLAKLINKHPDGKRARPIDAVAEFESIILGELDMLTEAANASLLRKNFANSDKLYVPKVFWGLCATDVLVVERIYGIPIGDIKALKAKNMDLKKLAEDGVKIFFTQVFKHNFFHADMHPGNIFVSSSGNYIGVDFGIMGSLSEVDQNFIAQIFLAFFNQDYKGIAKVYVDSGWVPAHINPLAFEGSIRSICEPMFAKSLGEISFGQVLLNLLKETKKFDISIQPQLLLLDKTLLNIEGLGRQLYPQLDLWATAKPFLEDLAKEKYNIKNTFAKLKQQSPELVKDLPKLPELTINALKQLDRIKDINNLYKEQTTSIVNQLRTNSNKQTNAIFAGAFIILAGILATNSLFIMSGVFVFLAVFFWVKSI